MSQIIILLDFMKKKKVVSFEKARKFARSFNFKNRKEWWDYWKKNKLPNDMSSNPARTYKNKGWKDWGDFLGTGNKRPGDRKFVPFEKAREYARSLKFSGQKQWQKFCKSGKLPKDIPQNPGRTYKKEFKGMGDWLGTETISTHNRKFSSFVKAREFVRSLNLKNEPEWNEYCKSGNKPDDIPSNPRRTYKKEWISVGDWLGTGAIFAGKRKYRSFKEARRFARSLELKKKSEWSTFAKSGKLPDDIPNEPGHVYENKGWISWGDWLGTGTIAPQLKEYLPWKEAKKLYQEIAKENKIKSSTDWDNYLKTHKLPTNLPRYPRDAYTNEKILKKGR